MVRESNNLLKVKLLKDNLKEQNKKHKIKA
jgi:hypothetical protein